ncbi:MAG: hypothetical protein FJW20_03325 [Acidimicrobiia bacterium]|nr:hypothetical protein [Acidimicrobiia bacterium]
MPVRLRLRRFGDLKVRLKLMVLHNIFFLLLSLAVYFAVAPLFDERAGEARSALFAALAVIYLLAVAALEWVILPLYVYRPLRLMLSADEAARSGDRESEFIDQALIPGDEIGQIMRSRNETLKQLRRHESELEELNRHLREKNELLETAKRNIADQDRLVSLGMLSAGIAHELNTPLAVLQGSIEKLIETVDGEPSQERLARMLRVTERLRRMSAGLLDFARVRRFEPEQIALHSLIEESWSLVALEEKGGRVQFLNRVAESQTVVGNPDRLIQLFVNLLRNALHAVESGGYIAVSAQAEQGWLLVAVDDNGPGIPVNLVPDIFEAFVTTRLDARGTGLGLTVAEGIVHQHGGTISASNREGGGARLEVRLPHE